MSGMTLAMQQIEQAKQQLQSEREKIRLAREKASQMKFPARTTLWQLQNKQQALSGKIESGAMVLKQKQKKIYSELQGGEAALNVFGSQIAEQETQIIAQQKEEAAYEKALSLANRKLRGGSSQIGAYADNPLVIKYYQQITSTPEFERARQASVEGVIASREAGFKSLGEYADAMRWAQSQVSIKPVQYDKIVTPQEESLDISNIWQGEQKRFEPPKQKEDFMVSNWKGVVSGAKDFWSDIGGKQIQKNIPIIARDLGFTQVKANAPIIARDLFGNEVVDMFSSGVKKKNELVTNIIGGIESTSSKVGSFLDPYGARLDLKETKIQELETKKIEDINKRVESFNAIYGGKELAPSDYEKALREQESIRQQTILSSRYVGSEKIKNKYERQAFEFAAITFAGSALKGLAKSPFQLASFGIGLVSNPIKTTKETISSFAQLPSILATRPISTIGEMTGSIAGQTLLLGVGKGLWTKAKDVFRTSEMDKISLADYGTKPFIRGNRAIYMERFKGTTWYEPEYWFKGFKKGQFLKGQYRIIDPKVQASLEGTSEVSYWKLGKNKKYNFVTETTETFPYDKPSKHLGWFKSGNIKEYGLPTQAKFKKKSFGYSATGESWGENLDIGELGQFYSGKGASARFLRLGTESQQAASTSKITGDKPIIYAGYFDDVIKNPAIKEVSVQVEYAAKPAKKYIFSKPITEGTLNLPLYKREVEGVVFGSRIPLRQQYYFDFMERAIPVEEQIFTSSLKPSKTGAEIAGAISSPQYSVIPSSSNFLTSSTLSKAGGFSSVSSLKKSGASVVYGSVLSSILKPSKVRSYASTSALSKSSYGSIPSSKPSKSSIISKLYGSSISRVSTPPSSTSPFFPSRTKKRIYPPRYKWRFKKPQKEGMRKYAKYKYVPSIAATILRITSQTKPSKIAGGYFAGFRPSIVKRKMRRRKR